MHELLESLIESLKGGIDVLNDLLALDVLIGPETLDRAIGLLEADTITRFESQSSKRECFHVKGDHHTTYLCVEDFCSCHGFAARSDRIIPMCKHLLAVQLSIGLQVGRTVFLSDDIFGDMLDVNKLNN